MTPAKIHDTSLDKACENIQQEKLWRQIANRLYQRWRRLQERVIMGLFGISGAITVASIHHVVQTCQDGNCLGCGRCAVALTTAVISASAGIAGRTSGKRRLLLIAVVILTGLIIYGFFEMLKRGMLTFPVGASG